MREYENDSSRSTLKSHGHAFECVCWILNWVKDQLSWPILDLRGSISDLWKFLKDDIDVQRIKIEMSDSGVNYIFFYWKRDKSL